MRLGVAILILLYFWIGPTPFHGGTDEAVSTLLPQLILLGLTGLALGLFLVSGSARSFQGLAGIGVLAGWLLVSALFTPNPGTGLRQGIVQIIVMLNAYLVLHLPRDEQAFAKAGLWAVALALGLSYFGVLFRPAAGIHQMGDLLEPFLSGLWRGHFIHKNAASAAMVVAVFYALYLHARGWRLSGWVLGLAALVFLVQTGGKTSLATLPLVIIVVFCIEKLPFWRWLIVLGGLAVFNTIVLGVTFQPDFAEAIAALGIDPSFTNRTDIWRIAMAAASEVQATGMGLHAFWGSDQNLFGGGLIETWAYAAGSAHNGFIDVALNIGLPGLMLVIAIFVIAPLRNLGPAFAGSNSPALTRLFARIWLFGIINACLESLFFARSGILWFCFVMACIGLFFQARTQLVAARATGPRGALVHA